MNWESSEWDDEEDWDDSESWDADADDLSETLTCSECGEQIYEDAEQCPYCRCYVLAANSPDSKQPTWVYVTAIVLLCILVLWVLRSFLRLIFTV